MDYRLSAINEQAVLGATTSSADLHSLFSSLGDLPAGAIQTVQTDCLGVIAEYVREYIVTREHRRLIYLPVCSTATLRDAISGFVEGLEGLLEASWPHWFGDIDFAWFRDDPLGNERLRDIVRELVVTNDRICPTWTTAAVRLATTGRPVRGASIDSTIQADQLSLALCSSGVILLLPFAGASEPEHVSAAVALVEWVARYTESIVVPIIPMHWPNAHPVDRLLFNAWRIEDHKSSKSPHSQSSNLERPISESVNRRASEISAISGQPHPLSDVEKKVWAYLSKDKKLGPLFRCNQTVTTLRGSRPRVDLLWREGAMIVELDGYVDHSAPDAFERDRHRDYELLMSGYHVLRITNDEVNRDLEGAVAKIRDVVSWLMHSRDGRSNLE